MSDTTAQPRETLLRRLTEEAARYARYAAWQERAYWIGSGVAAVCSAVAGITIAATGAGNPGFPAFQPFAAAALAIVPAVWAAIERSINLRRLALFNHGAASQLVGLEVELRFDAALTVEEAARRYADIVKREEIAFAELLQGIDRQPPPQRQAPAPPANDPRMPALAGRTASQD